MRPAFSWAPRTDWAARMPRATNPPRRPQAMATTRATAATTGFSMMRSPPDRPGERPASDGAGTAMRRDRPGDSRLGAWAGRRRGLAGMDGFGMWQPAPHPRRRSLVRVAYGRRTGGSNVPGQDDGSAPDSSSGSIVPTVMSQVVAARPAVPGSNPARASDA